MNSNELGGTKKAAIACAACDATAEDFIVVRKRTFSRRTRALLAQQNSKQIRNIGKYDSMGYMFCHENVSQM